MKKLRQAILKEGKGIGDQIVKVDMFLNHRLDSGLIFDMGIELAKYFRKEKPNIVLTVEASGIAVALATAHFLNDIPVVFAKKSAAANQSEDMLVAAAHSFTHGTDNYLRVDRRYLPEGSRILIVDDFLANGQATEALMDIVAQAKCETVGVGIAVEKGFQDGGKKLRQRGVNLKSLAVVTNISDGKITLEEDN